LREYEIPGAYLANEKPENFSRLPGEYFSDYGLKPEKKWDI
jgi:hypothetical protein